jgi:hypothetical protein
MRCKAVLIGYIVYSIIVFIDSGLNGFAHYPFIIVSWILLMLVAMTGDIIDVIEELKK